MRNNSPPFDLLIILDALKIYNITEVTASLLLDIREIFLPEKTMDACLLEIDTTKNMTSKFNESDFIKIKVNPRSLKSIEDAKELITKKFINGRHENDKWILNINPEKNEFIRSLLDFEDNKILHEKVKNYVEYCYKNRLDINRYSNNITKEFYKFGQLLYELDIENNILSDTVIGTLEKITNIDFRYIKHIYKKESVFKYIRNIHPDESYEEYIMRIRNEKGNKSKKIMIVGQCSTITENDNEYILHLRGHTTALVSIYKSSYKYSKNNLLYEPIIAIGIPTMLGETPIVSALAVFLRMPINYKKFDTLKYN